MTKFSLEDVKNFIRNTSNETKVYIGADSERYRKGNEFWADYTVAVVVHVDGNKGCKVFGYVAAERDYDQKKNRPKQRMMSEVYKAAAMYLDLADAIGDRHVEVHLDINPDLVHGSSCALQEAIGYVRGTCGITPKVKPESPAASFCADRLKDIIAL